MIPLLSKKALAEYTPEEYKAYIESLYQEPERAAPPKEVSASLNKKGTLTIRINRDPKYITSKEVDALAEELSWTKQKTWLEVRRRKIEVRHG